MRVLVVNAGSSSLKLQLLDGETLVAEQTVARWEHADELDALQRFIETIDGVDAVGHRVVHGGTRFSGPVLIDDGVVEYLVSITDLAPLHQPKAVAAIRELRRVLPSIPQIACFDTTFHTTIPPAAATYAVPAQWNARWNLRRYGFHGLSHSYAANRAAQLLGRDVAALRIVTCHLGAGASLCAVKHGVSVDTTMGFTPLEGLVMATRSGNVDPGMMLWLLQHGGLSVADLADGLELHGGLAGLAGTGGTGGTAGDIRDVIAASQAGNKAAGLALDVYVHRLVSLIGQMVTSVGGLDVLVFTGGIGEHHPEIRQVVTQRLEFLGVHIDPKLNTTTMSDAVICAPESSVDVVVVTAREDLQIVRDVTTLQKSRSLPCPP